MHHCCVGGREREIGSGLMAGFVGVTGFCTDKQMEAGEVLIGYRVSLISLELHSLSSPPLQVSNIDVH